MKISVAFVLFITCTLVGQVVSPKPPQNKLSTTQEINQQQNVQDSETINTPKNGQDEKKSSHKVEKENGDSDDESDYEDDDEDEAPAETPVLTCTAFDDNTACNAMCTIMGSIYHEPITSGTCDAEYNCNCQIPPKTTLHKLWTMKFRSKDILNEIRNDQHLSKKIFDVLKIPFQTPQQTKQNLASILSSKQLEKLVLNDKNTKKLFNAKGNPNTKAIQKYVAQKLKSLKTPLEGRYYTRPLVKALGTSDRSTFDHIVYTIRNSKNQRLNELVDEYIEDNKIHERSLHYDTRGYLIDILDTAITNETIKPRRNSNKQTKSSQNVESSTNDDDSWYDDNTNINEDSRWTLEVFDKDQVAQLKSGTMCKEKANLYKVCVTKTKNLTTLYWYNRKGSDLVEMKKSNNGDITQKWMFRNVHIELSRNANGAIEQEWVFGDSRWDYSKTPKGSSKQEWDGSEDWKAVEKYKKFIDSWCAINEFYMGKENCIIY